MTYNNLETQVTSVSGTWNGTAISFSTLGLSTSIPYKDQIEVERIFSSSALTAVKNNITTADLHKIFLLAKTEYTITDNTISAFSMNGSRSYTLTGGSSSGTAIPIPAISSGDSVIIRRKTLSKDTYVTWAPGTKLTTTQLNQQVGQLLRLNQELIYKLDTEYVRAADLTGTTAPITSLNNSLNMNSNTINNLANYSSTVGDGNNAYAVNKGYIDTNFVNRSTAQTGIAGAKTFTGAITLSSTLAVTGAVTLSSGLTVDTNTLVVDATNHRVGIGTATPQAPLQVAGTIIYGTVATPSSLQSDGSSNSVINSWNEHRFQTGGNERMRIEAAGNLILGNVNAAGDTSRNLDIYNYANGTSASSVVRLITNNTSGAASSIGQIVKYQNSGAFVIQNTDLGATAHIRLDVGNSERMRIDSAGRVGIGAASAGVKLTVTTTGVGSDGIQVINSNNSAYGSLHAQGTSGGIESWANGFVIEGVPASTGNTILSSYTGALSFQTARADRMRISSTGNVGIGTASPATKLDVNGIITSNRTAAGTFVTSGDGGYSFGSDTKQYIYGTSGNDGVICAYTTNSAGTNLERVRINGDGNVGIGTPSPTTKLAVNGTTSISGITTLSSTQGSTNTTSGALQVAGGVGIAENLYVGGYIDATISANIPTLFSTICNASQAIQAGRFTVTSSSGATTCGSLTLGSVAGAYTVTQATNKTTGVTLNKVSGQITMNNAALASNASVVFVFTNNTIVENSSTTSVVAVNHCSTSGGTDGAYAIQTLSTANGTCKIRVTNISGSSLSEALAINFVVLNGNKVTLS